MSGTQGRESEGERVGPEQNRRVGTAGTARQVGRKTKILPLVGYLSKYGRFYGGGLGS